MTDAVLWTCDASHLLDLIPPIHVQATVREHRDAFRSFNKFKTEYETWSTSVEFKHQFAKNLNVIYTSGEIALHTDVGFPPYSTLLLLRPNGYKVTGAEHWRGDDAQPAGLMMHFHAFDRHGLVRADMDQEWFAEAEHVSYQKAPALCWIAVILDSQETLTPEEALEAFTNVLKKTNQAGDACVDR